MEATPDASPLLKLSTILTALFLFGAAFGLYGLRPSAGLFAEEQPARAQPQAPESLAALSALDLRAPGQSELDQPLGRLALGLARTLGEPDLRGTSAASWLRWSALLHALACLLAYWLLFHLSASRSLACLGALAFSVHPMLAESVTWVSMSARLLASVWVLLGLGIWTATSTRWRPLVLLLGLCASASHPIAMPMGALALVLLGAAETRSRRDWLLASTLFCLGLVGLGFNSALHEGGLGFGQRLASAGASPLIHLRQALGLRALGDIIVHPQLGHGMGAFVIGGWLTATCFAGTGLVLLRAKADGLACIGIGLLWFTLFSLGGALSPYSETIGADSDGYLALFGLVLIAVGGLAFGLRNVASVPAWLSLTLLVCIGLLARTTANEVAFRRDPRAVLLRALDSQHSLQEHSTNFVAHRRLGLELIWHGDLTSADAHLAHALSIAPGDSQSVLGRARVAMQRDERQIARGFLDQARALGPHDPCAWERSAELNLRMATPEHNAQAIEQLERAIELNPHFARAHARLSSLLSIYFGPDQASELQRACRMAQRALELNPKSKEAWKSLGAARGRLGDLEGAEDAFQRSLALEPDYSAALAGLGQLLQDQGQHQRALKVLERSFNLHPLDPNNAYTLGVAYRELGRLEAAQELFRATLAIQRTHMRARESLARILLDSGDTQGAIEEARIMLEFRTDRPGARLLLGDAYARVGNYRDAILCLKIGIAGQPDSLHAEAQLAFLLAAAPEAEDRDGERALALAQELVQRSAGQHLGSLRALAAAHAELGDFESARLELARAQQLELDASTLAPSALQAEATLYAQGLPLRLPR